MNIIGLLLHPLQVDRGRITQLNQKMVKNLVRLKLITSVLPQTSSHKLHQILTICIPNYTVQINAEVNVVSSHSFISPVL